MKTLFNKFMMAMVAVVMVIGFSAFKAFNSNNHKKTKKSEVSWRFISNDPNDITNPNAYVLKEPNDPECLGESLICEIVAPADGSHPDLNAIFDSQTGKTYANLIEEAMFDIPTTNEVVISLKD